MDTVKYCQHCGKPLSAKAIQGLCPECFMKVGLGTANEPESVTPDIKQEPSSTAAPAAAEVARLFPQLEVIELLGQGGMGAVYKARQPQLDRLIALKILTRQASQDAGFAERFIREARALAKLNHPNIVAVYEFGTVAGLNYFIMEYVEGLNSRQLEQAGKLSAREALRIIPQICEALQFAHDEGVVHRDIKPENVLLDKKGKAKIADFGLAKILGSKVDTIRLTGARDFMGTPHYMAPEQVEHPQTVDHRADIYSLGVVFYEMLTGELPLGKFQPPSRKVQVDVRLDEVVLHALEKEPARRYQHASEVKTDLETIATTSAPTTAPAVVPSESNSWQPAILLVGGLISTLPLLTAPVLPEPINWIAMLFGSFGVVVSAVKLGGFWPFASPIFPGSKFTSRNLLEGRSRGAKNSRRNPFTPLRAAALVGVTTMIAIFLAAMGAAAFFQKSQFEHNIAIGVLLGTTNGLIAGVLAYFAFWSANAISAGGSCSDPPSQSGSPPSSGSRANALFVLSLIALLLLGLAAFLRFSASDVATKGDVVKSPQAGNGVGAPKPSELAAAFDARHGTMTDQILVEDLALQMLVAIREKDDTKLKALATDSANSGWVDALPGYALELRERFTQFTGKPFTMYPGESVINDDRAAVKCTGPKELKGEYIVLFFVKSSEGWRNWLMRKSSPDTPLADHLKRTNPETREQL